MLRWSAAVPLCPFLVHSRRFGVRSWRCRPSGLDILHVVRSIGRLLDRGSLSKPLPLVKDGDLIAIVQHMYHALGPETVEVTKLKASEADVEQGLVRFEDRVGNSEAYTAADLGRRHQSDTAIAARRELWHPVVLQLHRFMVLCQS